MRRSSLAEAAKKPCSFERKVNRRVCTLTPSQLARKRANDREAQRAVRARTKEHIDGLEREIENLRRTQGRDKTVQELLRRNMALEAELRQFKESMGAALTPSSYSAPVVYGENVGNIPSPRRSLFPSGTDCMPEYSQTAHQYVAMPNSIEGRASNLFSGVQNSSSSVHTPECGTAPVYIPTSVPTMIASSGMAIVECKEIKRDFVDIHTMMAAAQGYMAHQHEQQKLQSWNM